MTTSSETALAELSLREFCRRLSDRSPTPSGGSLAACLGALGASGVSMTLRLAGGEREVYQRGRADELDQVRDRLLELVERDAAAYDRVAAARDLPEGEREPALAEAFRGALETPVEVMEECLAGLRLAAAGGGGVDPHLACDCLAGAHALWAGLEDAYLMVRENAGFLGDRDFVAAHVGPADAMRKEAAKRLVEVRGAAERARA